MSGGWIDPVEPVRQMLDEALGVGEENECAECGVWIDEEYELCGDCQDAEDEDEEEE